MVPIIPKLIPNAIMQSITGNGVQQEMYIDFGITSKDDDIFIIRKTTSDGSFNDSRKF